MPIYEYHCPIAVMNLKSWSAFLTHAKTQPTCPGLPIGEYPQTPVNDCSLQHRPNPKRSQLRQLRSLPLRGLTHIRPAVWKDKNMLKIENPEVKSQVMHRLARVEGQLRGVQKMIADERDCKDIVQQLIAIRSAVQSASLSFMQDVASECLVNLEQPG
jgi:CsoR family transcriptional regulator, copper-sensing transcriptional repressor